MYPVMKKMLKYFWYMVVLLSLVMSTEVIGQQGLAVGSSVENLPIKTS